MSDLRETIKVDWKKKVFHGYLCVFDFIDSGHHVAYIPSLNLSGYGDSKEEAREMLINFVVKDFITGLFTLSEADGNKELHGLGWEKSLYFPRELSKAHIDPNGILKEFNLPSETKIESQLLEVA